MMKNKKLLLTMSPFAIAIPLATIACSSETKTNSKLLTEQNITLSKDDVVKTATLLENITNLFDLIEKSKQNIVDEKQQEVAKKWIASLKELKSQITELTNQIKNIKINDVDYQKQLDAVLTKAATIKSKIFTSFANYYTEKTEESISENDIKEQFSDFEKSLQNLGQIFGFSLSNKTDYASWLLIQSFGEIEASDKLQNKDAFMVAFESQINNVAFVDVLEKMTIIFSLAFVENIENKINILKVIKSNIKDEDVINSLKKSVLKYADRFKNEIDISNIKNKFKSIDEKLTNSESKFSEVKTEINKAGVTQDLKTEFQEIENLTVKISDLLKAKTEPKIQKKIEEDFDEINIVLKSMPNSSMTTIEQFNDLFQKTREFGILYGKTSVRTMHMISQANQLAIFSAQFATSIDHSSVSNKATLKQAFATLSLEINALVKEFNSLQTDLENSQQVTFSKISDELTKLYSLPELILLELVNDIATKTTK